MRITDLNRLSLWRRRVRVWDSYVEAMSADRLLNLWLHRVGLMGRDARAQFERYVRGGMTVLDVGANQGLYSLLLSQLVGPAGRVYSFEPDPDLFGMLTRNLGLNQSRNVTAIQAAAGSAPGELLLHRSLLNAGDNRLSASTASALRESVPVAVMPVDCQIGAEPVHFIKMDVQGWEWEALQGMQRTLERSPELVIFFEFWPAGLRRAGADPVAVLRWLESLGFTLRHPVKADEHPIAEAAEFTARFTGERYTDVVASRRPLQ